MRGEAPRSFSRRDTLLAAAVTAAALLIRVIYLLQYRSCPFFYHETMDAGFHLQWARAMAAGAPFVEGPYFRAPLYPWFLGWLVRVFGDQLFLVRLAQVSLGSMSCGLVYILGRQSFGRLISSAAGLACALYGTLVAFDAELLIPVLAIFLNLCLLLALQRTSRTRAYRWSAVSGLLLGLSAIARPNILLFAAFAAVWLAAGPRPRRSAFLRACLFCLAAFAVILPVTLRNAVVGRDAVLISSQGGVNLYIGNNPQADGVTISLPGAPATIEGIYRGAAVLAEQQAGRLLKPSDVSDYYLSETLRFVRQQPRAAAALLLRKAGLFWTHLELMNNRNLPFLTDRYAPVTRILPFGFWIAGPLGLMGLAASILRRRRELFPLWGFVICYMLSVIPFFVTARFRLPVVPVLVLLGSYGIGEAWTAVRSRAWKRATVLGAALGCGILLAASAPTVSSQAEEWAIVDLAKVLAQQGRGEEAVALIEEARGHLPDSGGILFALGVAQQSMDRSEEAFDAYAKAISIDPGNVPAHNNLATLLMRADRIEEAIGVLEAAVRIDPLHSGAWFNLGRAYAAGQRDVEAIACFGKGLRIQPGRVDVLVQLAASHARSGDFGAASATIDQAIGIASEQKEARMLAHLRGLQALYRSGRLEEPPTPDR